MNRPDVTDLAARAQACVDAGKLPEAKHLFGELCRVAPDNAEAWLMAGALHGETGAPEDALACLNTAIRIAPNYPEAHLTLAHLHQASGALGACYDSVKRAVEIDANYDEAWVLLGAVCCELKRFEEAERASREAISRWPENVQAHISLATALCNQGRESEAEPVVRTAMGLEGGNHPMVAALLGRVLLGKGDYEQSERLIQAALAVAPGDVTLRLNLANIHLGQGQHVAAEAVFRSIIEDVPSLADAWTGLGSALQGQYKLPAAEEAYRQAMALDADSLPPAYSLALLQEVNGDFAGAVESLKLILARRPGQLDSIGALAGVLEKRGDFDEAIQTLEPVLGIAEKNARIALAFQRLCGKMAQCSEAVSYIEAVLASEEIKAEDRAALHFALGSQYDQDAAYDRAFEQYARANSIAAPDYDPDAYSAYVDSLIQVFSPSDFSCLPPSNYCSEQLVFIVGMPRSGTSLVERVLSSHSAVFAAGELRNVIELADEVASLAGEEQRFPAGVEQLVQSDIDRLSGKYLEAIAAMSDGAVRVTDKLPHNFQYLGLIRVLFPAAKIIHCVRDARDTCLSCYSQNFFGYHPYTSKLEYLGRHYKDYQRLMEHWRLLDIPMLEVPYEALVEDPEAWSRKLVEYCGLDWEEQCLRYYETGQLTRTASYDQVRQPIYKSAMGRWQHYESHLSPLLEILGK